MRNFTFQPPAILELKPSNRPPAKAEISCAKGGSFFSILNSLKLRAEIKEPKTIPIRRDISTTKIWSI